MQSKITWQQIPLIRFTCPILTGAVLYVFIQQAIPTLMAIIISLLLLLALLMISRKYWAIPFFLFCLFFGSYHFQSRDQVYGQYPEVPLDTLADRILIVEKVKWDEGNKRWKGTFDLLTSEHNKDLHLYGWIEDSKLQHLLQRGDTLWVRSSLQKPFPPDIPGSFDFRQFLQRKNIPFLTYINEQNLKQHLPSKKHFLIEGIQNWRERTKLQLSEHLTPLTASILRAILFGDSGKLSDDTRNTFSQAGISHILAVSGMHVGILIMILMGILSHLKIHPIRKAWLQCVLIIISVWFYVAICDFAPSASRAALMASLYYLGKALKIRSSAMNALGCSALILFLIDPFYLLDLGTQLSFAAMAGILLSFPQLERLLIRHTIIPPKIASLLAISFAAQAGVAPLILYYFGSFPLLFWLFSIPAAYFAVFLFIGGWLWVITFYSIEFMQELLADILNALTQLFVGSLSSDVWGALPVWEVPYYPLLLAVLSYLIIIWVLILVIQPKRKMLRTALIHCLLITSIWQGHLLYQKRNLEIRPLRTKEYTAVLFVNEQKARILSSDSLSNQEEFMLNLPHAYPLDDIQFLVTDGPFMDHTLTFFQKTE